MEKETEIAIDRFQDNTTEIMLLLIQIETKIRIIQEMLSDNPEK